VPLVHPDSHRSDLLAVAGSRMKVVVVGSGLAGVATAWFLRENGAEVTVVDRCDAAAMETSHANAGMLTPSMADPWNHPGMFWKILKWVGREDSPMLLRPSALPVMAGWGFHFLLNSAPEKHRDNTLKNVTLARYSLKTLERLNRELDIEFDYQQRGTIKLFRDRETQEEFVKLGELLAEHGLNYQLLDRKELIDFEPCLDPVRSELVGGLFYPGDEAGDARDFCQQLATLASERGVVFSFNQTVTKLVTEQQRFVAVETSEGTIDADACVLAAGSFSPLLTKSLGLKLPVRPVKGYSITIPFGDWGPVPTRPLIDETLHLAVTPLGHRMRVAGTAELAGWNADIRDERIRNLSQFIDKLFPTFRGQRAESEATEWAGLRPMSTDGVPVLGATPVANLYLNTGYGHLGWTMSSGAGKLVANRVCGVATELDLEPFSLSRF